jgi:hypothetical protein
MLSSPIIDLAIGLTFVFGVTAAFASLATELIARLIGLRGAYLLSGFRELVDGGNSSTVLVDMAADYSAMRELMQGGSTSSEPPPPAQTSSAGPSPAGPSPAGPSPAGPSPAGPSPAGPSPAGPSPAGPSPAEPSPAEQLSATGALLGGPILGIKVLPASSPTGNSRWDRLKDRAACPR